jgi:predicted transcriptional regulator
VLTPGEILESVSNYDSLQLFVTIALAGGTSSTLVKKLKLTRKQYYSKMSRLISTGLIKKHRGDFCLTTFGAIVYEIVDELRLLSDRYRMLKATRPHMDITTTVLNENLEPTIIQQKGIHVSSEKKLVALSVA